MRPGFLADIEIAAATDIGGGKENQDAYFSARCDGAVIFGVLDGHGRDVGRLAAIEGRNFILREAAVWDGGERSGVGPSPIHMPQWPPAVAR